MKVLISLVWVFISIVICAQKKDNSYIEINEHYYTEPIYIQNSYSTSDKNSFCTDSVLVNDVKFEIENSSIYKIDLNKIGVKKGDFIKYKIYHKTDCYPQFINNEINRKHLVQVKNLEIDSLSILNWEVSSDLFKSYRVEQYRWNRWIETNEGDKVEGKFNYKAKVRFHSGINKFRVVLLAIDGRNVLSNSITYSKKNSLNKPITILGSCLNNNCITFSDSTSFEIFDSKGNFISKGFNNKIIKTDFKQGLYYLNYDNKTGEVFNNK